MHSSTFNSEKQLKAGGVSPKRAVVVLLSIVVVFLLFLEAFTRFVVEKHSRLEQTINRQYKDAIAIRRGSATGRKELLVIGNSLVGFDLNDQLFDNGIGSDWRVHRFWIHNTTFEDWRYGMERLFAEGSRPDAICLVLAAMHWRAPGIRGEYSAPYLFRAVDIPKLGDDLGYDRTKTSDLLFARISRFYAVRSEIRKQALELLAPDLPNMYKLIRPTASKPETAAEVLAIVRPRMKAIGKIANGFGTSLIVVVPPVPRPGAEWHQELREAATEAGVRIEMPMSYSDLPATEFVDDVHLTTSGASVFTTRLAGDLKKTLDISPISLTAENGR